LKTQNRGEVIMANHTAKKSFNAHNLSFLNQPEMAERILKMQKALRKSLTAEEKKSDIPVIDLSLYETDPEAWSACFIFNLSKYGFAIFKNHGINEQEIESVYDAVKKLFAQPKEILDQYNVDATSQRGYSVFGRERHYKSNNTNPDMKEFFQFGPDNLTKKELEENQLPSNVWPKEVPEFKTRLQKLDQQVQNIQDIVLTAIGIVLESDKENYADDYFKYADTIWRTIHYPALEGVEDTGGERSASHTDGGFATLLLSSNQKGLVVQPDKNDPSTWLRPETGSKYIIMNVGRILDRMTKGYLPATWHMVEKPEDPTIARVSIPRFIWPNDRFEIKEYDCPPPLLQNAGRQTLTDELIKKHPVGQTIHEFRKGTLSLMKDAKKHTPTSSRKAHKPK